MSASSSVNSVVNSLLRDAQVPRGTSSSTHTPHPLGASFTLSDQSAAQPTPSSSALLFGFASVNQPKKTVASPTSYPDRRFKSRHLSHLQMQQMASDVSALNLPSAKKRSPAKDLHAGKRVMAVINPTGSQTMETEVPAALVVKTPYSDSHAANQVRQRQGRQQQGRNVNNASSRNVQAPLKSDFQRGAVVHGQGGRNRSRNASEQNFHAAACHCNGDRKLPLNRDKFGDIVPTRRPRQSHAFNPDDPDNCGESMWTWHKDAEWGCDEIERTIDCDDDCPSFLEYLLCPDTNECEDDYLFESQEMQVSADPHVNINGEITFRQGGTEPQEVCDLDVVKDGLDEFKVTWRHPTGAHETYVVVVYPPMGEDHTPARGGPECGPCADDDECLCGTEPIFRVHLDGGETQCRFPVDMLLAGKGYVVEVANLAKNREESFGNSLVLLETTDLGRRTTGSGWALGR